MSIEAHVRITNPTGLHARPAVKLAQLAADFDASVQVRVDSGDWVKARSVAKLMRLKAAVDSELYIRANGSEAEAAVNAMVAFVERNFDEDPAPPSADVAVAGEAPNCLAAGAVAVAAPGLVIGVLQRLSVSEPTVTGTAADAEQERRTLLAAIERADAELSALADQSDSLGADVVAFQLGLLADEHFLQPALQAIAQGATASRAWQTITDSEIEAFQSGGDSYFRGRTADIRDLKNRLLRLLGGGEAASHELPEGAILLAEELTPSQFLELDWSRLGGAAVQAGSLNDHVALLARARGVALLIGVDIAASELGDGTPAILVAEDRQGRLIANPSAKQLAFYQDRLQRRRRALANAERFRAEPAQTADGRPIRVLINVDDPGLLGNVDPGHCDGIGLSRSELMFRQSSALPDADTQYAVYKRLLRWARGKPVAVRTLDAGGDKPIAGLTPDNEGNPFLGVRGLRLSLARPEVFRTQLRALARAAIHGPLKVMLPMVTVPAELEQARAMLVQVVAELEQQGIAAALPELGIMIEVPAAALTVQSFEADFYSIGSNDLSQYLMAAGRDCPAVATLADPLNPAMLELIGRVAAHGEECDREVSICGEMAANPDCLAALMTAGVTTLSVPPVALGMVKAALRQV